MLSKGSAVLSIFSSERPELAAVDIARLLKPTRSSTVYRLLGEMVRAGFLDFDEVEGAEYNAELKKNFFIEHLRPQ